MQNLAEETKRMLEVNKHTADDVLYVTDGKDWMYYEDFLIQAKYINYDSGYGLTEINPDLKVVGAGWWLERSEYDGAEWWSYKAPPNRGMTSPVKQLSIWHQYLI